MIEAAFAVHSKLGPGLVKPLYEIVLAHELYKRGIAVEQQKAIAIHYDALIFDDAFRADLVVESVLIVEVKSAEALSAFDTQRLLTYLKGSGLRLGLLINFGDVSLKNGIKRVTNGFWEEEHGFRILQS
ncbi:MAG TPA: GxxExxY protein [Chthoniobacterales bacterium]|nr:GxxExxY protein [Chthoniobacterales bacterium]